MVPNIDKPTTDGTTIIVKSSSSERKLSLVKDEKLHVQKSLENCPDLSVEAILEQLGGFSTFQILATLIIISPEIPAAMISLSPILTGTSNVFYECHSNGTNISMIITNMTKLCMLNCTGDLTMKPVQPYTSVVQEWGLVCQLSWISDLLTSVQMGGSMAGALICAHLADKFGRKKVFFAICFLMGGFSFASGVAPDLYSFAIFRFIAGFAIGGCFVVYLNYLMEFLTPNYRTICGCVSLWAVGEMLLALFGAFLPEWRKLTWAISLPVFLIFTLYGWIPESPRWLLCQNRTKESLDAFNQIARVNRKPPIDQEVVDRLQEIILKGQKMDCNGKYCSTTFGPLQVLKSRKYRNQLLVFMFAWMTSAIVYYGISFNMKNLTGNPYWNVFYLGLADLPGCFSGILFNNRFGRRKTFLSFLFFASTFLTVLVVGQETQFMETYPDLLTLFCLLSRFCNSASFAVMVCFTSESFPTVCRATCMGLCALCGNIGGILAPQSAYLGTIARSQPYLSYCILSLLTGVGALMLNDMNGRPLKDTLDDDD